MIRIGSRALILAAATAAAMLAGCDGTATPDGFQTQPAQAGSVLPVAEPDYPLLGERLPEFRLTTTEGEDVETHDLAGRWTVIDVWGLWCSDCINDMPYAHALRIALDQDPDVDFLSVHVPPGGDRLDEAFGRWGSLEAYFADNGPPFPVAVDADGTFRDALRIGWTPSYLLVGPDLVVRGFRTDLSATPEDGIKPVVRDIARIRSDLSAAEEDDAETDLVGAAGSVSEPSGPPDSISSLGAAGLTGAAPFAEWALAKAFDGYDLHLGEIGSGDEAYPVYEARDDKGVVFLIEPDAARETVRYVVTRRAEIKGPLGETVGVTRLEDIPPEFLGACEAGADDYGDVLFCAEPDPTRFIRVFRPDSGYAGPRDPKLMPDEALRQSVLVEMRYAPGG